MRKVIVRVFGGLGNQLFCYAAARRLAIQTDSVLVVDDKTGFVNDHLYHRQYQLGVFPIAARTATAQERLEPFSPIRRRILRWQNRNRDLENRSYISQEGIAFDPRLLNVTPKDTIYLEGYWQSENYFVDVQDTIREELRIEIDGSSYLREKYEEISESESVAVHIRHFDSGKTPKSNNVGHEYYRNARDLLEQRLTDPKYFIFTDRHELVADIVAIFGANTSLVSGQSSGLNDVEEFSLMQKCKHFIIANSTFSWWAAWLGESVDSHVIAPATIIAGGVTAWGFDGLLPSRWRKI